MLLKVCMSAHLQHVPLKYRDNTKTRGKSKPRLPLDCAIPPKLNCLSDCIQQIHETTQFCYYTFGKGDVNFIHLN